MVFRDFAQGAYRMRQIGKGQRLVVMVTPEVQQLMDRQLASSSITDVQSTRFNLHYLEKRALAPHRTNDLDSKTRVSDGPDGSPSLEQ